VQISKDQDQAHLQAIIILIINSREETTTTMPTQMRILTLTPTTKRFIILRHRVSLILCSKNTIKFIKNLRKTKLPKLLKKNLLLKKRCKKLKVFSVGTAIISIKLALRRTTVIIIALSMGAVLQGKRV